MFSASRRACTSWWRTPEMADDKPWRDEELMRELYHGKRMTQREIADHFDNEITQAGIGYCLDELGIEKRSRAESAKIRHQKEVIKPYTDRVLGYEKVDHTHDGDRWQVFLHRLLAVHKYGLEEIKGKVVHHKNNIPWDNRPENLGLMTVAEHAAHHHQEEWMFGNQSGSR